MNIMGIDPSGVEQNNIGHIGVYVLSTGEQEILNHQTFFFTLEKQEDLNNFFITLPKILKEFQIEKVVIEDFVNYPGKQGAFRFKTNITSEVIGGLKVLLQNLNLPFKMQTATQVKTRWSDSILMKYNIIEKRSNRWFLKNSKQERPLTKHERDAIRHAVHFFKKEGNVGK